MLRFLNDRQAVVDHKWKRFSKHGVSMIGLCLALSCGSNNSSVRIPSVSVSCAKSTCETRDVYVFWGSATCSIADISANKGVAQNLNVVGTSDCSGDTCTLNFTSAWTLPGQGSAGTITSVAAGTYTLCAVIDVNNDDRYGNAGDFYTASGVSVSLNSNTTAQTIPSTAFSAAP